MVIKNNPDLKQKINQHLQIHRFNVDYSDTLIRNVFIQQPLLNHGLTLPKKDSDLIRLVEDKVQSIVTKDESPNIKKTLLKKAIHKQVGLLKPSQYNNNPFQKLSQNKSKLLNGWHLVQESYQPFQLFVSGDISTYENEGFLENNPIGFFQEPFQYIALKKNNVTWMSITPFEIETMKNTIANVSGTVVALGLGLGYFATLAAMKTSVLKVIVVEKDPDVIALYQQHLQPVLPNQNKITIVQGDAYEYLKGKIKTDYIFVDIYRTADDGLPFYIAFKKLEKINKNAQWHYWLEESILGLFRRYLMIYLDEQLQGLTNENYQPSAKLEDKILAQIHQINKNISIGNVSELRAWLSRNNLINMISKINLD